MPPEPGLAREIERIHRLELAGVIGWWEAASLIAGLGDGKRGTVHMLTRLPLIDLQARWLLGHPDLGMSGVMYMPPTREQLVAAILDRVS